MDFEFGDGEVEHEELEPAFGRPDAVFAVPEEQRPARLTQSDDFVSIDGQVFFIRGVAPIPVKGRESPYSWGFWVKVSKAHFEEYQRFYSVDPPVDHPGFSGTIANQTSLVAPTLGLPVHVHLGQGKHRPGLMLLDETHPFSRQQGAGVTEDEVRAWSAACARGRVERRAAPQPQFFAASLEERGWIVAEPAQAGGQPLALEAPPKPGDSVKAPFVFLAAHEHGEVVRRIESMWVLLDEVRADGWWSGTLEDHPVVPAPIEWGSRVWLRAEHVVAHRGAEP